MIENRGWKCRIVSISHLADLSKAIRTRYEQGHFDENFYQRQLGFFSYDLPEELPEARSIIIVAVPTPRMRITFHWQGKPVPVVVPPTYVSYIPRNEGVQRTISVWLEEEGYSSARALLPLKTLASCSGLAEYGRNNICYIPGMGSFFQLVAAFSDLPCSNNFWREPKAMERCNTCIACMSHCPTGAIAPDRFLIYAEICLPYHNEAEADFPLWINPAWHHCLFGCMRCQVICPENRHLRDWVEDRVVFTEEETSFLVRSVSIQSLPDETAAKLKSLELSEAYNALCRNLSMIVRRDVSCD